MGITYGDHLIDSGYYDITPEQEHETECCDLAATEPCTDCPHEAATALDALQARVKELEAERDVLESSHRTVGKHLADEGERRIRAEQERDEAYERAVQAIRGASSLDENGYIVTKDAAIKAIRRLAAGTGDF